MYTIPIVCRSRLNRREEGSVTDFVIPLCKANIVNFSDINLVNNGLRLWLWFKCQVALP